jgi:hypothetical protein
METEFSLPLDFQQSPSDTRSAYNKASNRVTLWSESYQRSWQLLTQENNCQTFMETEFSLPLDFQQSPSDTRSAYNKASNHVTLWSESY